MLSRSVEPAPSGGFFLSALAPLGAIFILVFTVWLVFSPALPGIIQFDDLGNLSELNTITDFDSAWNWIKQGHAGPLGRPVALITFAVQYYSWPQPHDLLLWNIWLHIINALMVFWLALLMAKHLGSTEIKCIRIGFLTALAWAILPLLNTSTLFIIQRMTVLSSTFILMGIVSYIKLRGTTENRWPRQLLALSGLSIFGLLAVLTKENGALIVVYGLIVELCILHAKNRKKTRISVASVLLMLGCVLLIVKLLPILIWSPAIELQRGFNMPERVASQGPILLGYLKALFIPTPSELNPYRGFVVDKSITRTIWGVALWVALMLSPLVMWWRGFRLPALAIAWFFYGHLMESAWVPLELYFAHRNYFPAMGLVFCIVFGLMSLRNNRKFWQGVFYVYVTMLGSMTFMNTSLWGKSEIAAEIWAKEQPRSVRAAMNLAYEVERTQGLKAAQLYLVEFVNEGRDSAGLRLVNIANTCHLQPNYDQSENVKLVKRAIRDQPYEGWGTDILEKLIDSVRKGTCPGLNEQQIAEIAATYLSKPVYEKQSAIASNMLSILGLVAMDQGDMPVAMNFYLQAIEYSPIYSMSKLYLHLAKQYPDYAELDRLNAALANAPLPRKTSPHEWSQILSEIESLSKDSIYTR